MDLGLQLIAVITGIVALITFSFHLRLLFRSRELIKARLFLTYSKYINTWRIGSAIACIAILLGIVYLFFESDQLFMSSLVPFGLISYIVLCGIIGVSSVVYRIVR